jgi:sirohydrochlorin cobaltochelatase
VPLGAGHHHHHDHDHAHGHSHDHGHHPYPHADHPLGPTTLRRASSQPSQQDTSEPQS